MPGVFETNGAFSWTELMTTDVASARAFYGALFGWQYTDMPMAQGGTYTVISVDGEKVGGMMRTPASAGNMPSNWGSYVTVDNVDQRAAQAEKLGGTVCVPPTDIPNVGRFAVIQDPQGAVISMITYAPRKS